MIVLSGFQRTYFLNLNSPNNGDNNKILIIVVGNGHVDTSSNPGRD